MKTCTVCKEEKALELFKKDKRTKDGTCSWCKACHVKKTLEYRIKYQNTKSVVSEKKELKKQGFKKCQCCLEIMPLASFYKKYNDGFRNYSSSSCISCLKNANKENPQIRKGYKHKYKNKISLSKYYEINSEFHCLKSCHKHGKLTYDKIGIRQTFSKNKDKIVSVLYCLLCKNTERKYQHNEERRLKIVNNNENVCCVSCQEVFHHSFFSNGELRSLYPSCKRCRLAISKRFEDNRMMIKRYGFQVSREEYDELLNKQNNLCAICGQEEKNKRLAIDHCHKALKNGAIKIRGLLCQRCNLSLGQFEDRIDLLQAAIKYLEEND